MASREASPLPRFQERAVRYIIRPEDQKVLRLVRQNHRHRSYFTEIQNLSETGLAFILDRSEPLQTDEIVLLEFHPPESELSVACHGRIVRVENFETWHPQWGKARKRRVAVQFLETSTAFQNEIRKQIRAGFKKHHGRRRYEAMSAFLKTARAHPKALGAFALTAIAWLASVILQIWL